VERDEEAVADLQRHSDVSAPQKVPPAPDRCAAAGAGSGGGGEVGARVEP
jgi:hypothetical protein